ncbi:MAG TPA: type I restriction enzyme HsdR N-terminal domain-containing protein, partial [Bacteroidales bacterium]|nr:type I restriction enzyme HsdR N-terminal domain-containing protein [Bacteroidales bacterium]
KKMIKLNLPEYNFSYRLLDNKKQIFDSVRKKYVALTEEEWVRQNFIQWLIQEKKYPSGLIAIEKEFLLNGLKKRYDAVVFNNNHKPAVLVECKAPHIAISQLVFDQAARYNIILKVPYLIITNGQKHFCSLIDFEKETYNFIDHIPEFEKLF